MIGGIEGKGEVGDCVDEGVEGGVRCVEGSMDRSGRKRVGSIWERGV